MSVTLMWGDQKIDVKEIEVNFDTAEQGKDYTGVYTWHPNFETTLTVELKHEGAAYVYAMLTGTLRDYKLHRAGLQMVKKRNGHYTLKTLKGVHYL